MSVVLLERPRPGVAVIRLNRPEVKNALTTEVRHLIERYVAEITDDDEIKAIVLTGNETVFAVGADLKEQLGRDVVGAINTFTTHALWRSPKPVIAAVNGDAFGGGCELVLQCDFVIASDRARFAQPEVNVGFVPGGGATQRLPRMIGRQNAMYALLTGTPISAADALRMGLVAEVVEGDALVRALDLAVQIASRPPLAVRQIKEIVRLGLDAPADVGLALERRGWQLMFGTKDLQEGIGAILEGRPPLVRGE
ncbi:enoyl-CoA hydratase-related protein [Mesorhizobium sp. BAC0120]|uniref:enoyl-CoA hydratase-related protein n=1 Tax=Mesorhizobium sp. BAC0120 TaxID=3090670 RepID=UPI00298BE6B3|nr:enoyl-CoA hydratase-related protein [Mesorhizobium sp. BAC0120]MDW6023192.1 enoyl-CoA hydratase-related protein [Mesorhizobium sp. BAC0120]